MGFDDFQGLATLLSDLVSETHTLSLSLSLFCLSLCLHDSSSSDLVRTKRKGYPQRTTLSSTVNMLRRWRLKFADLASGLTALPEFDRTLNLPAQSGPARQYREVFNIQSGR